MSNQAATVKELREMAYQSAHLSDANAFWAGHILFLVDAYDSLLREQQAADEFIHRQGYRECDIAACNCGSWHDTYLPWRLRFYELSDALNDAGMRPLNKTALAALQELIAERDALQTKLAEAQLIEYGDLVKLADYDALLATIQAKDLHIAGMQDAQNALQRERDAARILNDQAVCAYCGHVGARDLEAIVEHMNMCEQHPLKTIVAITAERDSLQQRLVLMEELLAAIRDPYESVVPDYVERVKAMKARLAGKSGTQYDADQETIMRLRARLAELEY